jgi:hypothetical protein
MREAELKEFVSVAFHFHPFSQALLIRAGSKKFQPQHLFSK